jgi:hypothetical protein
MGVQDGKDWDESNSKILTIAPIDMNPSANLRCFFWFRMVVACIQ